MRCFFLKFWVWFVVCFCCWEARAGGYLNLTLINDSTQKTIQVNWSVYSWDGLVNSSHSMAPGSTWTYQGYASYPTPPPTYRIYPVGLPAPCVDFDTGNVGWDGHGASVTFHVGAGCDTNPPPCPVTADNPTGAYHKFRVGIRNDGAVSRAYQMYQNGTALSVNCDGVGSGTNRLVLDPGTSGTMEVYLCDTNGVAPGELVGDWILMSSGVGSSRQCWYDPQGDGYVRMMDLSEFGVSDGFGSVGAPGFGGGGGSGGSGVGFTNTVSNAGTNGIGWQSGNTNLATESTLRTGFDALWKVENQEFGVLGRMEQALYDVRSGIGGVSNVVAQSVGVLMASTNQLAGIGQGVAGLSNILIFGTNQLGLISRDLGSISNSLVFGTNQLGLISGDLGSISNSLVFGTNQLGLISGDLGSISNSLVFGTNQLGLVSENLSGISNLMMFGSNQLSLASSNLFGISNLLSGLVTNDGSGTSAGGTNAESAMASALSQPGVSGVSDNFDTLKGHIDGAGDGGGGLAGGSSSMFSFEFCGTTLNLDPEARFPGFMGVVKSAWTFIVLFTFGMWAGPWVFGLVRMYATVEMGGVPDLNAGVNIAGMITAGLVPIAFIALFVGLFTVCISGVLTQFGLLPSAASALSLGGNQGALYLLNSSFPVSLALSCGFARMGLPFTAAKLGFLAASAARFLWGK